MLIAIDHGNYAIKTIHHSFISGLAEHSTKPPMAEEILEYDGRYWTPSGQRLSYMRDKTRDDRFFILTLLAVAKELQSAGHVNPVEQVDLAVGLPPEHYGMLREKFANYFKRPAPIKFVYNDRQITLVIRHVMVFPQAFAAIANQKGQLKQHLRLFLVDIGGYTTDVLLLRSGKPDMQFCRSLETGVITMNNDICRRVSAQHDMRIDDEHIFAVLTGLPTILPDEVKETIRKSAKQHAQNILDQLRELQVDLRSNPAVFIGGGSLLFREYLEHSSQVIQATFLVDSKANAAGYKVLAEAQLLARRG